MQQIIQTVLKYAGLGVAGVLGFCVLLVVAYSVARAITIGFLSAKMQFMRKLRKEETRHG